MEKIPIRGSTESEILLGQSKDNLESLLVILENCTNNDLFMLERQRDSEGCMTPIARLTNELLNRHLHKYEGMSQDNENYVTIIEFMRDILQSRVACLTQTEERSQSKQTPRVKSSSPEDRDSQETRKQEPSLNSKIRSALGKRARSGKGQWSNTHNRPRR